MRNISFKRKESVIRGLEIQQEVKTHRPRNWDRIIYFTILGILLLFLVRYLVNTYLYIEADGQVLFDSVDIRNTDDCRVVEFFKTEGDSVEIGDSLFSFIPDQPEGSFNAYGTYEFAMGQKKTGDVSWAEKEIFQAKEKIKLNQYVIQEKQKMKAVLEGELQRIRNEVMLDVLPRSEMDEQITDIKRLDYDIATMQGENDLLQKSLGKLQGMIRQLGADANANQKGNGIGGGGNFAGTNRIFYSPLRGTITDILKNEFEVALKEEVILSIHRPDNVYIKGFFKQEDLAHLGANDIVELEFPDGSNGKGYIKRFYFSTYQLPDEFQKKYEPTTRSLSADIFPSSPNDLAKWKAFWKMGVKITKYKY